MSIKDQIAAYEKTTKQKNYKTDKGKQISPWKTQTGSNKAR